MKLIRLFSIGVTCMLLLFIVSSCYKNNSQSLEKSTDLNSSSLIQVFIAMVNTSRNFVYVDSKQITGAQMSSGSLFPSSGYAAQIPVGLRAFLVRDTLTAATQVPLSFSQNMQALKNYTIFVYDTINAPKQKTVLTDIVIPNDTTSRIRFANFIYNPFAVPNIDIYSFNRQANIFTNIPATEVTNFVSYPSGILTDTLYIRENGSATNIVKLTITGGLTQKRSYTMVYRGSHRGTKLASLFANN